MLALLSGPINTGGSPDPTLRFGTLYELIRYIRDENIAVGLVPSLLQLSAFNHGSQSARIHQPCELPYVLHKHARSFHGREMSPFFMFLPEHYS
jgi:hypothetical protein